MMEHRSGDGEKAVNRGGRPEPLTPPYILLLREIVTRMPHATLEELAAELDYFGDVRVYIAIHSHDATSARHHVLDACAAGPALHDQFSLGVSVVEHLSFESNAVQTARLRSSSSNVRWTSVIPLSYTYVSSR